MRIFLPSAADEGGRPAALSQFFAAARTAVFTPICDPADLCGVIQSDLDVAAANQLFAEAADLSWRAVDAKANDEDATAMCLWREVFGDVFPAPEGGCSGTGAGVVAAGTAAASRDASRRDPSDRFETVPRVRWGRRSLRFPGGRRNPRRWYARSKL